MKKCIDCRHISGNYRYGFSCGHSDNNEPVYLYADLNVERSAKGKCGIDAIHWERRPAPPPAPAKAPSIWSRWFA